MLTELSVSIVAWLPLPQSLILQFQVKVTQPFEDEDIYMAYYYLQEKCAGEEIVVGDDIYGGSDRLLSQVTTRAGLVVK